MHEHSNRNAYIAHSLSQDGYEVLAMDLRGHGKSGGLPGYMDHIQCKFTFNYINLLIIPL